jgi:hypothetical protein
VIPVDKSQVRSIHYTVYGVYNNKISLQTVKHHPMEDHDHLHFGASATTSPNIVSAWANIPPPEDHISVGSDAQHSYEVPIRDPESSTEAGKPSSQHNSRIRNARTAMSVSSSSQIPKNTGNSSRVSSRPMSTYNDHDSTVAGGSENLWDTTINTPRTELSIQERIANTAISGTIELLKQVGGVTVSATGALVAPPLHITRTVLLPSLFAAFKDFIASNSPVRLKDWFRIFSTSIYHVFNTLQNTEAGHEFSNRMLVIMIDFIDCLSAETTRQLLLDGMSCFVKFFEIIHTPIFQSYCEQLTISGCRLIDALSNGRNKLLLYDIQKALASAGELLADPVTTVALAEVTAYLCYALEMEDQQIQVDEHRHIPTTTTGNATNGTGGQRRRVRDSYQAEAVLQRDTLDNGHSVEEAILSSLGVDNNQNNNSDVDGSIPVSIVLDTEPKKNSKFNESPMGPSQNKNQDISRTLEWHERARNDVDVQVLREGILHRARNLQESICLPVKQSATHTSVKPSTNIDCQEKDDFLSKTLVDEPLLDLEEQDMQEAGIAATEAVDSTLKVHRSKQSIAFQPPDNDNEKESQQSKISPDNYNFGLPVVQREHHDRKEGENANEHFYRILDEILGNARKEAANKIIAEQMAQPTGMKSGISRSHRQNGPGNSTIKDRLNEIRLELKANGANANTTKKKNGSTSLDKTGKKVFLIVAIVAFSIIIFWFLMGCFGMYVYFYPSSPMASQQTIFVQGDNIGAAAAPQEIVIRVVKEIVHVNQDGKELGRVPWKQYAGSNVKRDEGIERDKIAECIASAYQ